MEFLSRSWSLTTSEIAKALALKHRKQQDHFCAAAQNKTPPLLFPLLQISSWYHTVYPIFSIPIIKVGDFSFVSDHVTSSDLDHFKLWDIDFRQGRS
ncbi:unnamed protein product [Arabis nemorensis]|uniref:VAN3-binding protein-like auxin canalisation domain-containing protein n=1 Tax=Arabis nemorensis TaxID=586526 RepID=A0A565CGE9_9BRAS|nr:unnamed protein product [Arabis nemorensis]